MTRTAWMATVVLAAPLLGACGNGDGAERAEPAEVDHSAHQRGSAAGGDARQAVHLTPDQERALGVAYTTAERLPLQKTIRTVGRIEASEDRVAEVTPKIAGYVEKLFVSTTGEAVRRGQSLLTLYSPELVSAQEELKTALRLLERVPADAPEARRNAEDMVAATRRRLSWWDVTEQQIDRLERTGEVTRALTFVSPVHGIVLEKPVLEGQRVMPGQLLYKLADLSEIWVLGEVFEQDLQFVHEGSQAHIEVSAYPGEHVMGEVTFVYPTVDPKSRTNHVRVTLRNPEGRLKPGMFATMFFDVPMGDVLSVPMEAVIITGERNLVFVHDSTGMLQPRQVVLGSRAGDRVQILSGLQPGEELVASANFLVDAESRLASGAGGMPGMPGMQHGSGEMQETQGDTGAMPGMEQDTGAMPGMEHDSAGEGDSHD